jgi:hypothetical protein
MQRLLISLAVAVVLSLSVSTWGTLENVTACVQAPGCKQIEQQPLGKLTTHHYGFPAPYKSTVTFVPTKNDPSKPHYAGYTSAKSVTQPFNIVMVLIDVVFWTALLYSLLRLLPKKKPAPAAADTTPTNL